MRYSREAVGLAPDCPLVLWDLASTEEMLEDDRGALKTYTKLFKLATGRAPSEPCWEGPNRMLSLLADCLYSVAGVLHRLGQRDKALWFIREHLEWRAACVKSIYPVREARRRLKEILGTPLTAALEDGIGEAGRMLESAS
jgi:hypothetical protein